MNNSLLDDIIDPQNHDFEALLTWLNNQVEAMHQIDFTPQLLKTFKPLELTEAFDHPLGPEASPVWRKFFIATLLADWACYKTPVDRADFARLKYVLTSAYRWTRLWFCQLPDGTMAPVGYTSWYPIAKFLYEGALQNQESIDDRGIFMPLRYIDPKEIRYVYAFNVSIIRPLRNTACSRRLIKAYQNDAAKLGQIGAMTVTVDEAGRKFSRMAKLAKVGAVNVQGEPEDLFVRQPWWAKKA